MHEAQKYGQTDVMIELVKQNEPWLNKSEDLVSMNVSHSSGCQMTQRSYSTDGSTEIRINRRVDWISDTDAGLPSLKNVALHSNRNPFSLKNGRLLWGCVTDSCTHISIARWLKDHILQTEAHKIRTNRRDDWTSDTEWGLIEQIRGFSFNVCQPWRRRSDDS